ncbi:hypothetical protein DH2020_002506 [Rehmannia glutinosa]|uniref:glycine--tRNA ligase n=2 Tax=Magnoliopsida TaxID=3398 RepID=A0ABR0XUH5_REHGL
MAILSLPLVTSILKKTPKNYRACVLLTAGQRIKFGLPLIFRPKRFSAAARNLSSSADINSSSVSTRTEQDKQKPSSSLSSSVLTFQQAIQRLQVGAGTMNPLTFLRVLGPEPWNVAYVEPSIRPDDSRYGENPNRLQRHTQFQVILKPDPGNSQDLFIRSLSALGINVNDHDIRFVEDNWESPVLGAWGLGWEIWMDGMEITQFTYFQQAGSLQLMPVSVEITYGLERILMLLQGVDHFKKIQYADGITYGELFLENELVNRELSHGYVMSLLKTRKFRSYLFLKFYHYRKEMSAYYLEHASVDHIHNHFDLFEAEARRLLDLGLAIPAYDQLLKTSHAFNVLDSRGFVGVTERARYFGRMRSLARQCAQLWSKTRESLGHPLGVASHPDQLGFQKEDIEEVKKKASAGPRTFILEIGTEELPPNDVVNACSQVLYSNVWAMLFIAAQRYSQAAAGKQQRLNHGSVQTCGTPRRLVVRVDNLCDKQVANQVEARGPPASKAFDQQGNPTKVIELNCILKVASLPYHVSFLNPVIGQAAEGFCRRNGVPLSSLYRRVEGKTEYVYVRAVEPSRLALEVLSEELPATLGKLSFPKSMRWNSEVMFSRPIRWILALHGDVVVPFTFAGVLRQFLSQFFCHSGDVSHGLRNTSSATIKHCCKNETSCLEPDIFKSVCVENLKVLIFPGLCCPLNIPKLIMGHDALLNFDTIHHSATLLKSSLELLFWYLFSYFTTTTTTGFAPLRSSFARSPVASAGACEPHAHETLFNSPPHAPPISLTTTTTVFACCRSAFSPTPVCFAGASRFPAPDLLLRLFDLCGGFVQLLPLSRSAESYTDVMHNAGIAIDIEQRKKTILEKSTSIVKSINGSVVIPNGLLDEVVNLVEAPHPVLGKFSETFLELPKDLLIMVMQKHQKYFAVTDQDGKLLPYFIAVANGAINEMAVRKGNEAVLRARYEDAKFFYELDTKGLEKLGTMLDKMIRVQSLVTKMGLLLGMTEDTLQVIQEAASLAMSDLSSAVVTEFTSLAGVMACHYALRDGYSEQPFKEDFFLLDIPSLSESKMHGFYIVAEALFEITLPRFSGDILPKTDAGTVLAITDRNDKLVIDRGKLCQEAKQLKNVSIAHAYICKLDTCSPFLVKLETILSKAVNTEWWCQILLDRLESLVGLFAAGCQPSSTNDPFGLRRISYGLVQLSVETNRNLELRHALELAAAVQPIKVESQTIDDDFFQDCLRIISNYFVALNFVDFTFLLCYLPSVNVENGFYLMDQGISPEVVRSVLAERSNWPCLATKSAHKMQALSKGDLLPKIIEAYSRPTRIVRGKDVTDDLEVDEAAFETEEERALWSTFTSLRSKIHPDMEVDDFVEASIHLLQPLEDFFNHVFVMVEDERIRKNRLALLRKISDLPKGIADLSILPRLLKPIGFSL